MASTNQKNDYDNEPDSMFYSPPQDDSDDDDNANNNNRNAGRNTNNRTNTINDSQLPSKRNETQQQVDHQNNNYNVEDDDEDDDERKRLNRDDNDDDDDDEYDNENPRRNNPRRNNNNERFDDDDDDDDLGGIEDNDDHNDHDQLQHSKKKRKCCACCSYKNIKNYCLTCYLPKCEFRGICGCPHGKCYGIMGVMTAVGGLMMNLYILGTCSFNRIMILNPVTGEPIPGSERGYGFNARETNYGQTPDYRQCTYYPDDEKDEIYDSWIVTGKMFAYISALLATIGFLILFSICCIAYSKSMFERWLLWLYIIAAITVTFSFFIFGSEFCQMNQCKVADGCGWAISAFFLHLLCANTVKSFPGPNPRPNPADKNKGPPTIDDVYDELYYDNENDKYQQAPLPDGQKRGVIINEQGEPEFDDGEDYFDELGNYIDPDKKDSNNINDEQRRQRGDNDDDDDEYTYGSDDDDEFEESDYDSDQEDHDTWKKRQDERKAELEERKRQKELYKPKQQPPDYSDSDLYADDADDNGKQGGGYVPPTTTPPYGQAPSSSNYNDDDIDPLSGIPYADPYSKYEASDDNTKLSAVRPEDRVFPLNDDNDGNIGVGYEHIDNDTPQQQSMAGSGSNETDPSNKSKTKKVLYGAPPRPNIHEPRDYDDDEDDDGPVMA